MSTKQKAKHSRSVVLKKAKSLAKSRGLNPRDLEAIITASSPYSEWMRSSEELVTWDAQARRDVLIRCKRRWTSIARPTPDYVTYSTVAALFGAATRHRKLESIGDSHRTAVHDAIIATDLIRELLELKSAKLRKNLRAKLETLAGLWGFNVEIYKDDGERL